ncbi:MAG TPA: hypothetical protein VHV75_01445 [Solirubrobacteraceae bacterium]|nr:hypothetical protein [Solirubrobacteraceae bacterium]
MHAETGYVASNLSSTSTAGTPLVTITGKGPTSALAERLAAAAATTLKNYFSSPASDSNRGLLQQYGVAVKSQQRLQARVTQLQATSSTSASALLNANAALAVARLRTQGLAAAFSASTQATGLGTNARPTTVTAATVATSDRKRKTSEFAVVGLIVGICLGFSVLTLAAAGDPRGPHDRSSDDATLERA